METKTFSGRANKHKLAYADALAEREFGMSYGQLCSSVMLDYVCAQHAFPNMVLPADEEQQRLRALERLREMGKRLEGSSLATLNDADIKERIAERYA